MTVLGGVGLPGIPANLEGVGGCSWTTLPDSLVWGELLHSFGAIPLFFPKQLQQSFSAISCMCWGAFASQTMGE